MLSRFDYQSYIYHFLAPISSTNLQHQTTGTKIKINGPGPAGNERALAKSIADDCVVWFLTEKNSFTDSEYGNNDAGRPPVKDGTRGW